MSLETVRVFIGTEPKTEIARKVLECSIIRRTKHKVEFTPMIGRDWEYPTDGIKVGTGFSLRRWMIPAACNFQGRAIYLDADQLVTGDIGELWDKIYAKPAPKGTSAWMTYQPDKFRKTPWPQSSVMLIDCEAAKLQWGWYIDNVLRYLRENPTQEMYANFMHATWMEPQPRQIETHWNNLNEFFPGKTRLLHYTKEPEQPWYKPDHPLAKLWQQELNVAIHLDFVTVEMLEEALSKWDVREDWRPTNGLHPQYRKFIPTKKGSVKAKEPTPEVAYLDRLLGKVTHNEPTPEKKPVENARKAVKPKVKPRKVLWVTTCAMDMWEASGRDLVVSYGEKRVSGAMLVMLEGMKNKAGTWPIWGTYENLEDHGQFLIDFMKANKDVVPEHLGGDAEEPLCQCKGGPFDPHDKRHKMPCLGHWFNKNAFRWLRKVAAQLRGLEKARAEGFDTLIWLDADCRFKQPVDENVIAGWFNHTKAVFYLKNKRPIMEAGVMGFDLSLGGDSVIEAVAAMYSSGEFRKQKRWDDSAIYQWCIDRAKCPVVDIANAVGDHAAVVPHSPLALYLEHDKGRHGRKLGIMT